MYNAKTLTLITLIILGFFIFMALGSGSDSEVTTTPSDDAAVDDTGEEQSEEAETVDGNSRSNPAGLNESFTVKKNDFFVGDVTFEVEMLELVSGNEAWDIVKSANMYNDKPDEGKEYILAKFRIKIISTEEDNPYDMNHAKFNVISGGGIEYTDFISVAGLDPDLSADLYEGAEHIGWTYFLVDVDDEGPVAVMDRRLGSEVWFDLRN